MRTIKIFSFLLVFALAGSAAAAPPSNPERWAIGFQVGEPTGLSIKRWLGGANAFDIGLGTGPGVRLHADYLFGLARLARESGMNLDLYLGVGGVVGVARGYCGWYRHAHHCHDDGDAFAGVRVPFGLDFILRQAPIEFGFEIAPGLWLNTPFSATLIDANIFVRFLL